MTLKFICVFKKEIGIEDLNHIPKNTMNVPTNLCFICVGVLCDGYTAGSLWCGVCGK
jgi:hypothetical protein